MLHSLAEAVALGSTANTLREDGLPWCASPLRLEPQFIERVWGAASDSPVVAGFYPAAGTLRQRIGEVWLTGNENRVAGGPRSRITVSELTRACGRELLGDAVPEHPSGQAVFPLLVKFLFTTDKLSVQVHPPDAIARQQNSWGKTEMWHILQAEPDARLAIGFRPEVPDELLRDAAQLRRAAESGAIEEMLDWRPVRAGESYFVPAGTVHAIGAGITLCEIQQNSDITYRLYDYNRPGTDGRPRPLHVSDAVAVLAANRTGGLTVPITLPSETGQRRLLAACPYFVTEGWEFSPPPGEKSGALLVPFAPPDRPRNRCEVWIGIRGGAEIATSRDQVALSPGEAVLVPAAVESYSVRLREPSVLLRTYCPAWQRDIPSLLHSAGALPEQHPWTIFPMSSWNAGVAG